MKRINLPAAMVALMAGSMHMRTSRRKWPELKTGDPLPIRQFSDEFKARAEAKRQRKLERNLKTAKGSAA